MNNRVLVVEKDKQLGILVSSLLSARGYKIASTSSAQDGLAELDSAEEALHLVVIGEQLSDIDGLGFIAKLRESNSKVPVVFVAKQWRDENFYRMLKEDLKVSLVVHRPLRSTVFGAQLSDLLGANGYSGGIGSATGNNGASTELTLPLDSHGSNQFSGGEFGRLKARFVGSIPGRLSNLEILLAALARRQFSQAVLEKAITVAHNLKGTSLSWGYEELGRASELMETTLRAIAKADDTKLGDLLEQATSNFSVMAKCAHFALEHFNSDLENAPLSFDATQDEQESNAAKVLVVSNNPFPQSSSLTESGLVLDLIHVTPEEALDKASHHLLDAALIEIGSSNISLSIARKLRDLIGNESLPLGFISTPETGDTRAEARHAGSSLFLGKPLDPELANKVISQLITMREGGRFRVLVVDDDVDLANLTARCLGQFGMLTRTVNDPLLVMSVLQEFNPDLILLDVNMPGMSGFEICRNLRNSTRWRDVPILFLTGQTDLNSRLTAYEAGADDYLPKPVINVELLTRVKVRLERARELKERSERDLLTGLLLRRAFSDQLNGLIAEASRYDFHFCLCLMDVDHFKKVNDSYGHHAGDEVLSSLGLLLRKRFRVEDIRGRWGGEEFILAFKHENKEVMRLALTRVLDELYSMQFHGDNNESFRVSFSAGLATFPDEASNAKDLIQLADKRLYVAKQNGRKQIVVDSQD